MTAQRSVSIALVTISMALILLLFSQRSQNHLVISKDKDLGDVWASRKFKVILPVLNSTTSSIKLKSVLFSCNCTSANVDSVELPSHSSIDLDLTIDLFASFTGKRGYESELRVVGRPVLEFAERGQADVVSPIVLSGRTHRWCLPSKESIDFGLVEEKGDLFALSDYLTIACAPYVKDVIVKSNTDGLGVTAISIDEQQFKLQFDFDVQKFKVVEHPIEAIVVPVFERSRLPVSEISGDSSLRIPVRMEFRDRECVIPNDFLLGNLPVNGIATFRATVYSPQRLVDFVLSGSDRVTLTDVTVANASFMHEIEVAVQCVSLGGQEVATNIIAVRPDGSKFVSKIVYTMCGVAESETNESK